MFSENQNVKNSAEENMKKHNKHAKFVEEVTEMVSPVTVVDEKPVENVEAEVSVFPDSEEIVKEEAEALTKEEIHEPPKAKVVNVDNLRIRTTPSADNNQNVKFVVQKGTEVVILGESEGEFIHVAVKREIAPGIKMTEDGYAMLKFLEFI